MRCTVAALLFTASDFRRRTRELLDLPKMGFGIALGVWLRGLLCAWDEQVSDPICQQQSYSQSGLISGTWSEFIADHRSWECQLCDILMFHA